ncbi:MAG: GIY-YIG nuclease family protein [Halobacteria archaeon]
MSSEDTGGRETETCSEEDGTGHYVYIVRCSDGSLYTGYTTDVDRRIHEHNAGEGAKYTRGRTPVTLVYLEGHGTCGEALSREHEIKEMTREGKQRLVESFPL